MNRKWGTSTSSSEQSYLSACGSVNRRNKKDANSPKIRSLGESLVEKQEPERSMTSSDLSGGVGFG